MRRTLESVYTALLYCYPPALRRAHARDMQQAARGAIEHEGLAAAPRLLADLAVSVPYEWWLLMKGLSMIGIGRDLAHAVRLLRHNIGFTLAAVVTLALGIGANTAMFSLADATLLRPLAIADPARMVAFSWSSSYPDLREYYDRNDVFSGVIGTAGRDRVMFQIDGTPEVSSAAFLSGGAFEVLGVGLAHGRGFGREEERGGAPIVAVLAYDFWRTRFAGSPDAIGRVIYANGHPITIIGVAEPGFRGTSLSATPRVFMPLTAIAQVTTGITARPGTLERRGFVFINVLARLKPDVTVAQAAAALDAQYRQQHPAPPGEPVEHLRLLPLTTRALGSNAEGLRRFVTLLVTVVALTLLVGCANLANLLLARGASRRREIGVRLALGAGRARVVRQVLVESVLIAALGGAAGIAVALIAFRLLSLYQLPGGLDIRLLDLRVNGATLIATSILSIATGLLFGAAPAWRASRVDVMFTLRGSTGGTTSRSRVRSTLLAVQVAVSLALLAGSALFLRSLENALSVPLGFSPPHVALASVNLPLANFDPARKQAFYDETLRRVRGMPTVTAASWASVIPTRGVMMFDMEIDGRPRRQGEDVTFYVSRVGPDYFRAAGTRIVEGRAFEPSDRSGALAVAMVNEEASRRFFDGHAIGRRLKSGRDSSWYTIVGVAENTKVREIDEQPEPTVYFDFDRPFMEGLIFIDAAHLFVRSSDDASALLPRIAGELRAVDGAAPIYDVQTFEDAVAALVMPQKMGVTLLSFFSVLALGLAAVGIYGVASYVAALRTREIGVRIALGAPKAEIRRLVVRQGLAPVVAGVVAGLAIAFWAGPLAGAFLFGLSARDPWTLTAVTGFVATVALVATWIPARRASRLDPVQALRQE